MSRVKLRKPQRDIVEIIKQEGGKVMGYRKGGVHLLCDYTFDGKLFFTATLPSGTSISPRWLLNFRACVRNNRGNKS